MNDVQHALDLANAYIRAAGGVRPGMCWPAAWTIRDALGWTVVEGQRDGLSHAWNLMLDGRWFDPTAGIFGDDGPQIVSSDDDRYVLTTPPVSPSPEGGL